MERELSYIKLGGDVGQQKRVFELLLARYGDVIDKAVTYMWKRGTSRILGIDDLRQLALIGLFQAANRIPENLPDSEAKSLVYTTVTNAIRDGVRYQVARDADIYLAPEYECPKEEEIEETSTKITGLLALIRQKLDSDERVLFNIIMKSTEKPDWLLSCRDAPQTKIYATCTKCGHRELKAAKQGKPRCPECGLIMRWRSEGVRGPAKSKLSIQTYSIALGWGFSKTRRILYNIRTKIVDYLGIHELIKRPQMIRCKFLATTSCRKALVC